MKQEQQRFEALRISHGVYNKYTQSMDYSKYSVDGKLSTTLNWTELARFELRENAVDWILQYRKEIDENITAYDEHGYGTKELGNVPIR